MATPLRIVSDLAKVKKLLGELRELANAKPIDRDRCIHIFRELYVSYNVLTVSLVAYVAEHKKLRRILKNISRLVESGSVALDRYIKFCMSMKLDEVNEIAEEQSIQLINSINEVSDEIIIDMITMFYSEFMTILNALEQLLDIPSGFQYLIPLIEKYGVNINWIVAITYLSKMEVVVNDTLKRLGVNVKGVFKERVNALLKELEKRGVQFGELEKLLTSTFWDLRNKVVHGGYTPSEKELQIIVLAVNEFLGKIKAATLDKK